MLLKASTRVEVTTLTALLLASCAAEFLSGSFESTCAYSLAVRVRALLQGSVFTKLAIILFGTWALFNPGKELTASLSFSCIYTLSLLDPACSNVVSMLRLIVLAVFGLKRISKACTEPERNEDTSTSEDDALPPGSICLDDCSFTWSNEEASIGTSVEAALRDVSLKVEPGSLVGIVGSVGSGKSTLLSALQGDVQQISGRCRVMGTIACMPQSACIYNMSIRDNILFGKPHDASLYNRVLSACDLLKDMAGFPTGDLTEVGQKGATLSGGQKQRIALARAVYSESSVYLLDDTLSALDVHVAAKVFDKVIGQHGLLRKKTRLVVCTQTQYLQQMKKILLVADRQVTSFNSVSELLQDPRCAFALAMSTRSLSYRLHNVMIVRVLGSPVGFFDATPRGRVLNRLSVELDVIDSRFYLGSKQVLQSLTAGIARIIVTGLQLPTAAVLAAVAVTFYLFTMVFMAKSANMARRFESVSLSRLLQHVAETRDTLSVVRSYGVEHRFTAHCHRLVNMATTGLLAHVNSLRCSRFLGGLCGFVVILVAVIFAILPSGRSTNLVDEGSSVGLALSSSMGISLLIVGSTGAIFFVIQALVSFERCLEYTRLPPEVDEQGSQDAARIARRNTKSCAKAICIRPLDETAWPSEGKLEFDRYSASYKPGVLPDVLTDVSFIAHPREKVGIVGRTGAGKSSLLMAVLRVLKASAGCIRIDDVDIASVPLRRLRSAVTVIPQDPCLTRGALRDVLDPTGRHSDSDVWCALAQAHLTEFVAHHSLNIRMDVGDGGSNLSAGQRQLVCLARALLRRPRIILMDEATSHMDGNTDRTVQTTLRESFAYCTVLTIAHRLETVLDYDKILVMAKGRTVEFGPTQQLASNPDSAFHAMLRQARLLPENSLENNVEPTTHITHL
ncbi:ATP-binding cassette sub-family C member 3 [Rhipicephalus sanguineus]|uniref:ATP-binding cassette sub-family C member 3 n=1 Tax=Rhipicephalus sanguineus TaxID=34632 RepID=UPI0020C533B3|nr:ATP-binding cassette sub-family C member 3 [Rhipicephalus sanguineus]